MFNMDKKELNVKKLNDVIGLSHKILKILFVLLIVVGVYAGILLLKELKVLPFIFTILGIISPLFIGIFIAWLLDPLVTKLHTKGLRRPLGAAVCYILLVGFIVLIMNSLIPVLSTQTTEFVSNTLPSVFDNAGHVINGFFDKLQNIQSFDIETVKTEIFDKLQTFATSLTSSLPEILVNLLKALLSGLGVFFVGLIIGFYLLLDFHNKSKKLFFLIPVKYREETHELLKRINVPLRRFINGALVDMSIIFVICSIGFSIIGLKAPLLFALFCAITNVIPYAGPYIGGIPAVVVGLTQGVPTGIAVLIFIFVVQTLEGNFIQPLIMSRSAKLSPVTIIVGLLVFGYFFGILGMIISTPTLGVAKVVLKYFDEKYKFLNFEE